MPDDDSPTIRLGQSGGAMSDRGRSGEMGQPPPTNPGVSFEAPSSGGGQHQTMIMGKPPPALAWLVVMSGFRTGKLFPLDPSGTVIGRDAQNDIVLDDEAASRQHAKLRKETEQGSNVEQFYIYDLASANGTLVNDKKVVREALKDGDRVRIGETLLVFKTIENAAKPKETEGPEKVEQKAVAEKPVARACSNCGTALLRGAKFCYNCGTPAAEFKACGNCGQQVEPEMKFCPNCGTKQ